MPVGTASTNGPPKNGGGVGLKIGFGIGGFGAIDNAAHVGGLLTGAWLGFVVVPRGAATLSSLWQRVPDSNVPARQRNPALIALGGVAVAVGVLILALLMPPFWA